MNKAAKYAIANLFNQRFTALYKLENQSQIIYLTGSCYTLLLEMHIFGIDSKDYFSLDETPADIKNLLTELGTLSQGLVPMELFEYNKFIKASAAFKKYYEKQLSSNEKSS